MQGKVKQFPTGRLLCTPGAMDHVSVEEMMAAYYRHREGDWGDVCPEDWRSNDQAIRSGMRILSAYHTSTGQKFWIITEADAPPPPSFCRRTTEKEDFMHIDASGLVAALKKAPEERLTQDRDVSEYVMEHIFLPLRRGEPVVFADLDFEAFTDEDIWGLQGWIEHRERIAYRLSDLAKIFCGAKPVSRTGRAFC